MLQAFGRSLSDWLRDTRRPVTWIYCSSILFPMAFALVAALFLTFRIHSDAPLLHRFFAIFYLALMITLASVPRSILPILLIWLAFVRFRPSFDANRVTRYLGFLLLMIIAGYAQSKANDRGFNFQWLAIGWLSLSLPRLALPMLRDGLGEPRT